jgi:hypothetical protein
VLFEREWPYVVTLDARDSRGGIKQIYTARTKVPVPRNLTCVESRLMLLEPIEASGKRGLRNYSIQTYQYTYTGRHNEMPGALRFVTAGLMADLSVTGARRSAFGAGGRSQGLGARGSRWAFGAGAFAVGPWGPSNCECASANKR